MATIAQAADSVTITSSTVDDAVGVCFFDPIEETLLEISDIPNHYLSVEPNQQVLRKYYTVVTPGVTVSYIKVSIPNKEELQDSYSIKMIVSDEAPTADSFSGLPDYNSYRIISPTAGAFIPLWILVSSKSATNEVLDIELELEYE